MSFFEILLLAIGLSMDAFAVAIAKGLALPKIKIRHALLAGLYFGGFQGVMPLIDYFLGSKFAGVIKCFDHWLAFAMLAFIGINMIIESFKKESSITSDFSFFPMLLLALATSIDALVAGVSFAILKTPIFSTIAVIGITTFVFSFFGVSLGAKLGSRCEKSAERLGGLILICIGTKILLEHTLGF